MVWSIEKEIDHAWPCRLEFLNSIGLAYYGIHVYVSEDVVAEMLPDLLSRVSHTNPNFGIDNRLVRGSQMTITNRSFSVIAQGGTWDSIHTEHSHS